jgi:hydrogenase small subunit
VVIAAGTCAMDGGLPGAAPNPTGAKGVKDLFPNLTNYAAIAGCPSNVVNMVATIVYLLTYNSLPPRDSLGRPNFAYRKVIHEDCPREDHYEAGRFVRAWGDDGHKNGWCLYLMGCKGPRTHSNCERVKWNEGVNWAVGAGHGCVGCTENKFWDNMPSLYTPG